MTAALSPLATASDAHGGLSSVLLALTVILLAGKLAGSLAERVGQPGVLGELLAGVALGNLALLGWGGFSGLEILRGNDTVAVLAEVGVILLLFSAGLESTVGEMMKVGKSSLAVAVLGVVAPIALGWLVTRGLLADEPPLGRWFIGATLCATSVGITARVLRDLGKLDLRESRIVLGAAAIDDVLGLLILAVVAGAIEAAARGVELEFAAVAVIAGKAAAFLLGAAMLGGWASRSLFALADRLRTRGLLLPFALAFCFLLSWLAGRLGLAPIVGAFAAGLVLEDLHYRSLETREERELKDLVAPLVAFLAPVFFVLMGMGVDLRSFSSASVVGLAAALTVAAVLGKMACALGVLEPGLNRLAVAVGMIPRGEVGLIFAAIGAKLVLDGQPIISPSVYSAVVIMVAVTTLITPPVLQRVLRRST
jgi:Kef-type K+ transport system membrane component KefB